MNLTIKVDAKELNNAMHKAPGKVISGLNKWVARTTLLTERVAKTEVPPNVDTGRLQSSIHSSLGLLKGEVKPNVKYAYWVHEGRRPGKMPPYKEGSDLNSWARRKGMNPFLVARSIAKKGTKGNKFMDKAFKEVKPLADRDADSTLSEIIRSI